MTHISLNEKSLASPSSASHFAHTLHAKSEAKDWKYLGEGALNIILAYCGHHPSYKDRVLRLRKTRCANVTQFVSPASSPLSDSETALSPEIYGSLLASYVWGEQDGPLYYPDMIPVLCTSDFLSALSFIEAERPIARRSVSFLLVDHTVIGYILLDGTKRRPSATVAIEIKPKWPWEPNRTSLLDGFCLFCRHQALKSQLEGLGSPLESHLAYCPCLLYSDDVSMIESALFALLMPTSHKNGRISRLNTFSEDTQSKSNLVASAASIDPSQKKSICTLAAKILSRSSFLTKLKTAILNLDSEGIFSIYEKVPSIDGIEKEMSLTMQNVLQQNGKDNPSGIEQTARYLMSKTLRDCSFILTFDWSPATSMRATLEDSMPAYQIQVIDLDQKSHLKLADYYTLAMQLESIPLDHKLASYPCSCSLACFQCMRG